MIEALRQQHKKDLANVVDIVLSHQVRDITTWILLACYIAILQYLSSQSLLVELWEDVVLRLTDVVFLQGVKRKNKLILRLMGALVYPNPVAYREELIRFAALNHTNHSEVFTHTL